MVKKLTPQAQGRRSDMGNESRRSNDGKTNGCAGAIQNHGVGSSDLSIIERRCLCDGVLDQIPGTVRHKAS